MTFRDGPSDFHPTHVVPQEGMAAWEAPDVTRPTAPLDPFLPVQLLSRSGEWGEILCANGWSAWVDGRLLVAVPQPPPTAGGPAPARAEDPRPHLDRTAGALDLYRHAVGDLAEGRVDSEQFGRSLRNLRAGIVIDGASVWVYDETAGRWMYGDGTRLATYAVAAGPGAPHAPAPPPTQTSVHGVADVRENPRPPTAAAPPTGPPQRAAEHEPTRIVDTPGTGTRDE
ncbi:hypothetical protein [Streptomyces sp. ISL-94]|uniref:hypothetical protein n=1 Tax=Streptomyces sp. ISL-94 TaxID=2819190 RepID=UPI001BEC88C7|nr:hypothetical protein [Streptomyces sp. ISL-94]MBT2477989.1 hypothetical protein [Streptomyces sp. ISL-94]